MTADLTALIAVLKSVQTDAAITENVIKLSVNVKKVGEDWIAL